MSKPVKDITVPLAPTPAKRNRSEDFARAQEQWGALERELEECLVERDQLERALAQEQTQKDQILKLLESEREFYQGERVRYESYLRAVTGERDRYKTLWATLKATLETAVDSFANTLDSSLKTAIRAMGRVVDEAKILALDSDPPPAISQAPEKALEALEEILSKKNGEDRLN